MRSYLFLSILVSMIVSSCIPQRKLTYLQDKLAQGDIITAGEMTYRLKPGDILHIRVIVGDENIYNLFNIDDRRTSRTTRAGDFGDPHMYVYGYLINQQGNIQLPVIGDVQVSGYTLPEVHKIVLERAKEYLVDAIISVRLVNFKVTVLGEVNRPGTLTVYDDEFTIMDAIGAAGDMTDYGNRKVHVIRKTGQGRQFTRLDVTGRDAVTSKFYYLQPNDVIYVEPMKAKRFALAQFPYAAFFSAISTAILLFNFFN